MEMKDNNQEISKVARRLMRFFRERERVGSQQEKDELWSAIELKVRLRKNTQRLKYIISIAASAAVILGACWILRNQLFIPQDSILNVAQSDMTESEDVVLIMSDNKQVNIKSDSIVTYSKNGQILLQEEILEADKEKKEDDKIEYNQIIVPRGKRIQLILSDASRLWINSGSKVIYPRSFTGKKREIFVDGEVYLEVEKNKEMPFIVKTNNFDVQVLGTSFDICTYKGVESSVVLVRGAVNVKDNKGKKSELKPNEKIVINENGLGEKKIVDVNEYVGWINNLLVLKSQPLGEVFAKLHLYYDVKFEIDESVRNMALSGKLDLKDKIEDVVKSISKTAPITYTISNGKIIIEKKNDTMIK